MGMFSGNTHVCPHLYTSARRAVVCYSFKMIFLRLVGLLFALTFLNASPLDQYVR